MNNMDGLGNEKFLSRQTEIVTDNHQDIKNDCTCLELISTQNIFTERWKNYSKTLIKLSYSDNSYFWYLQDEAGRSKVEHSHEELAGLLMQLLWEQEVDIYCSNDNSENLEIKQIYDDFRDYNLRILNNVRRLYWGDSFLSKQQLKKAGE